MLWYYMKFSRYNLVLFEKERISQFFLIHSREIHFFFPMKHSIPSRKMIFRLWIAAAANCFLVLALSLKTLLMNYDIFHILTIETNIFSEVLSSTIILTWSCNFYLCILL